MVKIFSGSNQAFLNEVTLSDGAIVDGVGIGLTNTEAGRIVGGLTFAQGGHTFTNAAGAILRVANGVDEWVGTALTGSAGADTVINSGRIGGRVSLGGGADRFVSDGSTHLTRLDLGEGDDEFDLRGVTSFDVEGGLGYDRATIGTKDQGNFQGSGLRNFEELRITGSAQLSSFSGFQKITVDTPDFLQGGFMLGGSLIGSENPNADIFLIGSALRLHTSSAKSIKGTDAIERVELNEGAAISGAITLGGGDDTLQLWSFRDRPTPPLPLGGVDAGAGVDHFNVQGTGGDNRSFDFSKLAGFEKITLEVADQLPATYQVANASGLVSLSAGFGVALTITNSASPGANVHGALGGSISLDAGTSIARYGFPLDSFFDLRTDIDQVDDRLSTKLTNAGVIGTDIVFYIGDDTYDGSVGKVGGIVYGNGGNDILIGSALDEHFQGGFGADTLAGNGGADILRGDAGGDRLNGGAGVDQMFGGLGNDIFFTDTHLDVVNEAVGEGSDSLYATGDVLLPTGSEVELIFLGGSTAVGSSTANQIVGNAQRNSLSGLGGNDYLEGGAEGDALLGGAGNDYLDGGTGIDILQGETGDDTYIVDHELDQLHEVAAEGYDRLYASVSYAMAGSVEIEFGVLTGSAIGMTGSNTPNQLVGNGLDNVLIGMAGDDYLQGEAGADRMFGDAGADFLDGGLGADIMLGGLGDDIFLVDNSGDDVREQGGQGYDRVYAGTDVFLGLPSEVEFVRLSGVAATAGGSDTANQIVGTAGTNLINGYGGDDYLQADAGDDYLLGAAGADYLDGGLGADRMDGGAGDDLFVVDDLGDQVVEAAGAGFDRVFASANLTLGVGSEVELALLTGVATIAIGSDTANRLVGNMLDNLIAGRGGADQLEGAAGDDLLDGGAGDDALDGGIGFDSARFAGSSGDYSVTRVGGGYLVRDLNATNGDEGEDRLNSVERLVFSNGAFLTDSLVSNQAGAALHMVQVDPGFGFA